MQARDFCTAEVWKPRDCVLNMYKFSLVRYKRAAILFGGMYVASGQNKGNCSNSVVRFSLDTLEHEHIKTQGVHLQGCRMVSKVCCARRIRFYHRARDLHVVNELIDLQVRLMLPSGPIQGMGTVQYCITT